jgi:hypothetical protein
MGQVIVGFDIEWKTTFTKVCLLVVFINVLDGGNYKINWTFYYSMEAISLLLLEL